jgi:hypothetical protein
MPSQVERRQRRTRRATLAMTFLALLVALAAVFALPAIATTGQRSPLVGRWSHLHTCQELLAALQQAGLAATAPAAVGDFFPNSTPQQLAAKPDICSGAVPMKHSHFFTKLGTFGSVDQSGQQVDNGRYRILSHHRLRINNGTFHFRIINGNRLRLSPIITPAMRSAALASPLDFSVAVWEVAVSYTGQTWKRVRCGGWCSR